MLAHSLSAAVVFNVLCYLPILAYQWHSFSRTSTKQISTKLIPFQIPFLQNHISHIKDAPFLSPLSFRGNAVGKSLHGCLADSVSNLSGKDLLWTLCIDALCKYKDQKAVNFSVPAFERTKFTTNSKSSSGTNTE